MQLQFFLTQVLALLFATESLPKPITSTLPEGTIANSLACPTTINLTIPQQGCFSAATSPYIVSKSACALEGGAYWQLVQEDTSAHPWGGITWSYTWSSPRYLLPCYIKLYGINHRSKVFSTFDISNTVNLIAAGCDGYPGFGGFKALTARASGVVDMDWHVTVTGENGPPPGEEEGMGMGKGNCTAAKGGVETS